MPIAVTISPRQTMLIRVHVVSSIRHYLTKFGFKFCRYMSLLKLHRQLSLTVSRESQAQISKDVKVNDLGTYAG
jgi:hypothetical protein